MLDEVKSLQRYVTLTLFLTYSTLNVRQIRTSCLRIIGRILAAEIFETDTEKTVGIDVLSKGLQDELPKVRHSQGRNFRAEAG